MQCKTWTRDSYGLFDYETNDYKESILYIGENRIVIRDKHDVKTLPLNTNDLKENILKLGDVFFDDIINKTFISSEVGSNLKVNNKTMQDLQDKIWHVIRASNLNVNNNNNNENKYVSDYQYILRKNDIIKLGRIKYLVKDLNIVNHQVKASKETFNPHYESTYINY